MSCASQYPDKKLPLPDETPEEDREPTVEVITNAIKAIWSKADATSRQQQGSIQAVSDMCEESAWFEQAVSMPAEKWIQSAQAEVVSSSPAPGQLLILMKCCWFTHYSLELYHVLQTEWLAGRGTLFGSLVALATAAHVMGVNVRIWSDREDGGLTAGAVPLDPYMDTALVCILSTFALPISRKLTLLWRYVFASSDCRIVIVWMLFWCYQYAGLKQIVGEGVDKEQLDKELMKKRMPVSPHAENSNGSSSALLTLVTSL